MSSPSRDFHIVDQALSLFVDFEKKRIEGTTSVRMCLQKGRFIPEQGLLSTHLCAKQMNIEKVDITDLQMYHKEKKAIESFAAEDFQKHWFYPETARQIKVVKSNFEKCPPSSFAMRDMMRKIYVQENIGFLKCSVELTPKARQRMSELFAAEYLAFATIKVHFSVESPIVAGSFIKTSEGGNFFIKSNRISLSRCLFPCLDFIDDYYKLSRVRIITDLPGADVFVLGKMMSSELIDGNKFAVEFEVNKIINVNFLPIIVGKFEVVRLTLKSKKELKLYCQTKNLSYRVQNNEMDHISFFNRLLEFEDDVLKLDHTNRDDFTWLYMDIYSNYSIKETVNNEFVYRGDCLYFYKMVVLDCGIVIDKKSMDTFNFNQSEAVLRFMYSLHLDKLALKSLEDFWIFSGASQFIADVFLMIYANDLFTQHVFEMKKRRYYKLVAQGKDVNPLSNPNFMHPSEASLDHCYNLKSCLIFHMISAYLKLSKATVSDFASLFLQHNYCDETKKSPVYYTDTKRAYKKIKLTFGIKIMKDLQQFLQFTGCSELFCEYTHDKKGNRIKLSIRQVPIHLRHYREIMEERFNLEKFFAINSPIKTILDQFQTSLITLGDNSEGFISADSIKAFLDDDGRLLLNSYYNSLKYLSGQFCVIVTETNDVEYNEEIHELNLEEKPIQELGINMRIKFRRVVQKKGGEIDGLGGIAFEQDMNYNMGSSNAKYSTGEYKNDNVLVGGAPYVFIKVDPYNHYLRKVLVREGENIYLNQLDKEMKEQIDLVNIYRILESLVTDETSATVATVNKIESYLKAKDVDQLIKIEMINTLVSLNGSLASARISKILLDMVTRIKFEGDHSLKPNDFHADYFLLNHLIDQISRYERKLKKQQMESAGVPKHTPQTDQNIIDLLLNLLQKNDNSQNNYDDTFYQANILRSLFRCLNVPSFNQILNEVDRFLKIEFYTHYDYKYLIDAIFSEFTTFISSHYDHIGVSLSSPHGKGFYSNMNLERYPSLIYCLERFKGLAEKHMYDPILCRSIFTLNYTIHKKVEKEKPWDILIWGLKYVETARKCTTSFITNKILEALQFNMELNRAEFRDMQRKLNVKHNKYISSLLFDIITSPYAYIDVQYRYYFLEIYKMVYDEFVPICNNQHFENFMFPLDLNWLSFKFELNFEKNAPDDKRIITLNHLSMQNRRKTISGQLAPSQGSSQYNLRELIFQNFKFTKESPTWRNLAKQIINVLLSEKMTVEIENELSSESGEAQQSVASGDLVVKLKPTGPTTFTLKNLKKNLMKPSHLIHSMEEFKDELFKVINHYIEKKKITKEVYLEYEMFSKALIAEAEKILKEKSQKEEEKLKKMKQLKMRQMS